jgi:hypothetical protein
LSLVGAGNQVLLLTPAFVSLRELAALSYRDLTGLAPWSFSLDREYRQTGGLSGAPVIGRVFATLWLFYAL